MAQTHPIQWQSTGITHQGNIRDHNEDAWLALPEEQLWLVADGMGGHTAGDVASRMIVEQLRAYRQSPLPGANVRRVTRRLQRVNQALLDKARPGYYEIIGSTVAILLAWRQFCICLWAGDSRIYRFRDGRLKQVSRDHNQLEIWLDSGLTMAEASQLPGGETLSRAVGADEQLEIESQMVETEKNDLWLLCSDGLNKEVADAEIETILNNDTLEDGMQKLLDLSLQREGQDNITIVLARYGR